MSDPSKRCAARHHCWHNTKISIFNYPAQQAQCCCFCGQIRTTALFSISENDKSHGQYLKSMFKQNKNLGMELRDIMEFIEEKGLLSELQLWMNGSCPQELITAEFNVTNQDPSELPEK